MRHWQEWICMYVCMWASVRALLFSGYPLLIGLFQSLLANDEFQSIVATTCWNLIWWNGGCQHLMYSIFPLNLRAATQAALSLVLPPLRQWSSICSSSPMCLSQRLLADLALTWPRKQKIRSFLTESTKFNTQHFSTLCKPCCPSSFKPSDNNW